VAPPQPALPQQAAFPYAGPAQAPQATPTLAVDALSMLDGDGVRLGPHSARRRHRKLALAGLLGVVVVGIVAAMILFILVPGRDEGGTVEVISVPEGAEVEFDGRKLEKRTPVVIPVIDLEQRHMVRVTLQNYQPWRRNLTLSAEDTRIRVLAVLTPIYGKLNVRSTPTEADVYVNGEHKGKTPLTVENLLPNEDVNLELRKRRYKPATRILKWRGQTYLTTEITLRPSR
jgi:hypothetical protein